MTDNHENLLKDRDTIKQISIDNVKVLETRICEVNGMKVLCLSGYIDAYSLPLFKEVMTQMLDEVENDLIIDMRDVTYMDSSGFGVLITAIKRLIPKAGTINLTGCSSAISRLMHVTHLDTIISLHRNIDDAIKAISQTANRLS